MNPELRWLELRHLRLVRAIVDYGTLTRAASARGATQSALSQQLIDLEARIGAPLFVRGKRRMVPTDMGEAFLVRAEAVLQEQARLEGYVARLTASDSGTLRLAIDNIVSVAWLPIAARRFRERFAKVDLRVVRSGDIVRDLAEDRLDVAITPPRAATKRVAFLPLLEDEMVVVLPLQHPLARKRVVRASDLAGQDLIYHMELRQSALYRSFLAPARIRLGSFTLVEQIDAVLALVKAGLGLTVLPRMTVQHEIAAGSVAVRAASHASGGFVVSWSAAVAETRKPFVDAFIELARAAVPSPLRRRSARSR